MKKKLLMYAATALLMCITTPVWAWHGNDDSDMTMDGPRKDKGSGAFRMLNGLNLTPEQQSKIDAIMEQHREKLGLMHEKTEADRNALRDAIHKEVFDEQMIRKASRTLSADKEEMDVLRGRMFSEILTVLTPHQTEQLNEIRKMRREQRECREKCRHMAEE